MCVPHRQTSHAPCKKRVVMQHVVMQNIYIYIDIYKYDQICIKYVHACNEELDLLKIYIKEIKFCLFSNSFLLKI